MYPSQIGAGRYENKGGMKIRVIGDGRGSGEWRVIGGAAGNGARRGPEIDDHDLSY